MKNHINAEVLCNLKKNINGVDVEPVILADSAFRFSKNVMKPYPFRTTFNEKEKIYNYRLSKCRRVVENAFGHLKGRFRRIGKGIDNDIDNASLTIKCFCVLHNFLNDENDHINQKWYHEEISTRQPDHSSTINDHEPSAEEVRKAIMEHLCKFSIIHIYFIYKCLFPHILFIINNGQFKTNITYKLLSH